MATVQRRKKRSCPRPLDVTACPYVVFEFPATRDLGNGDWDEVCRVCFEWCTENSCCNIRYNTVQGRYVGSRHPEMGQRPVVTDTSDPSDTVDTFPICDRCYEETRVNDYQGGPLGDYYFSVLGCDFDVDCDFRMND